MAFDQKPGLSSSDSDPLNDIINNSRATRSASERKGVKPIVKVGIGFAAVAAAAGAIFAVSKSGNNEAPTAQPTVATSAPSTPEASPSETSTPKGLTPKVELASTGFTSVNEAVAALKNSPNAELKPDFEYKPLIDAANGDVTLFKEMTVSSQDLSINYGLNALYLNELKPLMKNLEAEQPGWNRGAATWPGGPVDDYKDTQAVQYLLGTVINEYQAGTIDLPAIDTTCPAPDKNDVNWEGGGYSSILLPPLGPFMYSTKVLLCPDLGPVTTPLIRSIKEGPMALKTSIESKLPTTAKAFQIKYDILNSNDPNAVKVISTYMNQ